MIDDYLRDLKENVGGSGKEEKCTYVGPTDSMFSSNIQRLSFARS
jgi:hypothetical protein